jgi:hypothetical protein
VIHINVKLDDDLVEALDRYMAAQGLENRSQTLRHVLRLALLSDWSVPTTTSAPEPTTPVVQRNTKKVVRRKQAPAVQKRVKAAQRIVDGVIGREHVTPDEDGW